MSATRETIGAIGGSERPMVELNGANGYQVTLDANTTALAGSNLNTLQASTPNDAHIFNRLPGGFSITHDTFAVEPFRPKDEMPQNGILSNVRQVMGRVADIPTGEFDPRTRTVNKATYFLADSHFMTAKLGIQIAVKTARANGDYSFFTPLHTRLTTDNRGRIHETFNPAADIYLVCTEIMKRGGQVDYAVRSIVSGTEPHVEDAMLVKTNIDPQGHVDFSAEVFADYLSYRHQNSGVPNSGVKAQLKAYREAIRLSNATRAKDVRIMDTHIASMSAMLYQPDVDHDTLLADLDEEARARLDRLWPMMATTDFMAEILPHTMLRTAGLIGAQDLYKGLLTQDAKKAEVARYRTQVADLSRLGDPRALEQAEKRHIRTMNQIGKRDHLSKIGHKHMSEQRRIVYKRIFSASVFRNILNASNIATTKNQTDRGRLQEEHVEISQQNAHEARILFSSFDDEETDIHRQVLRSITRASRDPRSNTEGMKILSALDPYLATVHAGTRFKITTGMGNQLVAFNNTSRHHATGSPPGGTLAFTANSALSNKMSGHYPQEISSLHDYDPRFPDNQSFPIFGYFDTILGENDPHMPNDGKVRCAVFRASDLPWGVVRPIVAALSGERVNHGRRKRLGSTAQDLLGGNVFLFDLMNTPHYQSWYLGAENGNPDGIQMNTREIVEGMTVSVARTFAAPTHLHAADPSGAVVKRYVDFGIIPGVKKAALMRSPAQLRPQIPQEHLQRPIYEKGTAPRNRSGSIGSSFAGESMVDLYFADNAVYGTPAISSRDGDLVTADLLVTPNFMHARPMPKRKGR